MDMENRLYEIHGTVNRIEERLNSVIINCPNHVARIGALEKSKNFSVGVVSAVSVICSVIVTFLASLVQAGKLL